MTTTFNEQLLGEILAKKYLNLIRGEREKTKRAPKIQTTCLPNGTRINWKSKFKITNFAFMKSFVFLFLVAISFTSCKKCHTCKITTSVYRWQVYQAGPGTVKCCGEVVPPVTVQDEICGLTNSEIKEKEKGSVVVSSAPISGTRTQYIETTTLCECQ